MARPISAATAVKRLDAIPGGDGEEAHHEADQVLLAFVPADVRKAYNRLVERADFWSCA